MSISWNPVTWTEFITASTGGSVRVWRVSSDDGTVAVRMLWGSNLRNLCTADEESRMDLDCRAQQRKRTLN
ncbi:hypothetical protein BGZ88_005142 [Linnemannia elongata]|nr:hypothetical protein BGZ88_005142 [Linnemannia elongata]